MGQGQRPVRVSDGGRGKGGGRGHPQAQRRQDERGYSQQGGGGSGMGGGDSRPYTNAWNEMRCDVAGSGYATGGDGREGQGRRWVRGGDADLGRGDNDNSGRRSAAARMGGASGTAPSRAADADDDEQERQLQAQLAAIQAKKRAKGAQGASGHARGGGGGSGAGGNGGRGGATTYDDDDGAAMHDGAYGRHEGDDGRVFYGDADEEDAVMAGDDVGGGEAATGRHSSQSTRREMHGNEASAPSALARVRASDGAYHGQRYKQ